MNFCMSFMTPSTLDLPGTVIADFFFQAKFRSGVGVSHSVGLLNNSGSSSLESYGGAENLALFKVGISKSSSSVTSAPKS